MHRRDYIQAAGATAFAGILAGCASEETPTDAAAEATTTPTATVTRTATVQPTTTPTAEPETATPWPTTEAQNAGSSEPAVGPLTVESSGQTATDEFDLIEAPLLMTYEHTGSRNFQVQLVAADGTEMDGRYLVNKIGAVEGGTATPISNPGRYLLDVTADGSWAIRMVQWTDPEVLNLPLNVGATGSWYDGPYRFSGVTRFAATHSGRQNFIVRMIPLVSPAVGPVVFNQIGEVDVSTTIRFDGVAYLDIDADGEWTLATG